MPARPGDAPASHASVPGVMEPQCVSPIPLDVRAQRARQCHRSGAPHARLEPRRADHAVLGGAVPLLLGIPAPPATPEDAGPRALPVGADRYSGLLVGPLLERPVGTRNSPGDRLSLSKVGLDPINPSHLGDPHLDDGPHGAVFAEEDRRPPSRPRTLRSRD